MQSSAVPSAANLTAAAAIQSASSATTTLLDPAWVEHLTHQSFTERMRSPYPAFGRPGMPIAPDREPDLQKLVGLFTTLHAYDQHTSRHSLQVERCAQHLSRVLGLPEHESMIIRMAAIVHDIGKIAVPTAILSKPGRLTVEEFIVIKRHPADGARILEQAGFHGPVVTLVLHHHEWYDGTGYQSGLMGEAIPFGARVLQTADCIDAMMSPRSYKTGFSADQVIAELQRGRSRQFDPHIADAAIAWLRDYKRFA